MPSEITVQTLAAWRADATPHLVLDVREPPELAVCTLPGALAIPMSEIQARLSEIPDTQPIVVMCHHGARSARVAAFLRQTGRANVLNLTGGIDAWAVQIDPAVPRY